MGYDSEHAATVLDEARREVDAYFSRHPAGGREPARDHVVDVLMNALRDAGFRADHLAGSESAARAAVDALVTERARRTADIEALLIALKSRGVIAY